MNKCEICKVYVSCYDKEKVCAFEHNGDKDICPLDDEYINLSIHDNRIRVDERANVISTIAEIVHKEFIDCGDCNGCKTANLNLDEWSCYKSLVKYWNERLKEQSNV